ncbi:XapX domain-containing protein [Xanthomonas arboricola]
MAVNWKFIGGVVLGVAIGVGCRAAGIPSPAPTAFVGALLVLAMTCGYAVADQFLGRRAARHLTHCGGPSGRSAGQGDA